ncbi:MAG: LuxR C-terminal-related transcriptional regulator [Anaerolineaceae bacterium]|nr:LuxR C-terminal-related transcriptional regulator [Anaerolineaceae bacterium]
MSQALLRSKTQIPSPARSAIERHHLLEMLEKIQAPQIIEMIGPAGYGKTSLLASWLSSPSKKTAWYSIDREDNDLETFLSYFIQAAKALTEPVQSSQVSKNMPRPLESFDNLQQTSYFVLDGMENIENPEILRFLETFINHLNQNLLLIFSSRVRLKIPLARLRTQGLVSSINSKELAFSLKETDHFIRQCLFLNCSNSAVLEAYQISQGWPASLQLLDICPSKQLVLQPSLEKQWLTGPLKAYFTEEICAHLSENQLRLIEGLSVPDEFSYPIAKWLADKIGIKSFDLENFENLLGSGLLLAESKDPKSYKFHQLFRTYLLEGLAYRNPGALEEVLEAASLYFEKQYDYRKAVQLASQIKDSERFISRFEGAVIAAIHNNRVYSIFPIHHASPENAAQSPILSLILAWQAFLQFDVQTSAIWLKKTEQQMLKQEIKLRLGCIWNTLTAIFIEFKELFEMSTEEKIKHTEDMDLRTKGNILYNETAGYGRGSMILALKLISFGDYPDAMDHLREMISTFQESGNWLLLGLSRLGLGHILIRCGNLNQAEVHLGQVESLTQKLVEMPGLAQIILNAIQMEQSRIHTLRNELNFAEAQLKPFEEDINFAGSILAEMNTLLTVYYYQVAKQNYKAAHEEIQKAKKIALRSETELDNFIIEQVSIELDLLQENTASCQTWLKQHTLKSAEQHPFPVQVSVYLNLIRYHVLCYRKTHDQLNFNSAMELIKMVSPKLIRSQLKINSLQISIQEALLLREAGMVSESLQCIQKTLKLAESEAIRSPFLECGPAMAHLLLNYQNGRRHEPSFVEGVSETYVSDLILRFIEGYSDQGAGHETLENVYAEATRVELLTKREKEVLFWVEKGLSNQQIALQLSISLNTVKRHLNSIFNKLGVNKRIQAVKVARHFRLI